MRRVRSSRQQKYEELKDELEEKIAKVKDAIDDDYKRNYIEPIFDLTKLKKVLDKVQPPLDIKGFFSKIIKSPDRFQVIIDDAIKVADDEEKSVLEQLKEEEEKSIYDFANAYVRQLKPLPQFFNEYNLLGDIHDISSDEEDAELLKEERGEYRKTKLIQIKEEAKRRKKRKPIFESVIQSRPFQLEREQLKYKENRRVRMQPIPFGKFKEESLKTCLHFYKLLPWIKDVVKEVYVAPISANFDETFFIKTDAYEHINAGGYALTSDEIEYFYRPKEKYYELQCYGLEKHYEEDPEILHIYWKNQTFSFKIGIIMESNRFLIQNPEILTAEENFLDNWFGKSEKRKKDLLESSVIPSDAKTVSKNELLRALTHTIPNAETSYTNHILSAIVNKISDISNGTRDFFTRVADLIVFIEPNITFVSQSIFIKRLSKMLYKPEILAFLTEKEKLPEIFNDPSIPDKTVSQVKNILFLQRERIFDNLVDTTVMYDVIPTRKATKPFGGGRVRIEGQDEKIIIGLPEWKNSCENLNEVVNIPDEDLVFYTEQEGDKKGLVYCFQIEDLLDRFEGKNNQNPITGIDFSNEFLTRFLSVYSRPRARSEKDKREILGLPSLRDEGDKRGEGSLIKLIKEELLRLENNVIGPEFFVENEMQLVTKCFGCKQSFDVEKGISSIHKGKKVTFCSTKCFGEKNW